MVKGSWRAGSNGWAWGLGGISQTALLLVVATTVTSPLSIFQAFLLTAPWPFLEFYCPVNGFAHCTFHRTTSKLQLCFCFLTFLLSQTNTHLYILLPLEFSGTGLILLKVLPCFFPENLLFILVSFGHKRHVSIFSYKRSNISLCPLQCLFLKERDLWMSSVMLRILLVY